MIVSSRPFVRSRFFLLNAEKEFADGFSCRSDAIGGLLARERKFEGVMIPTGIFVAVARPGKQEFRESIHGMSGESERT